MTKTLSSYSAPIPKTEKKVSIKAIEVPNTQTDPLCNSSIEQQLQNIVSVEGIVDELQERFRIPIRGWNRNILVEMAQLHTDKRRGFIAPTIKTLHIRLKIKKLKMNGKFIEYNNLRKKIKRLHKKGLIVYLPDRNGHAYQYVLSNMQDLVPLKERNNKDVDNQLSSTQQSTDEKLMESMFYQIITRKSIDYDNYSNNNNIEPEPEFHHIQLKSRLREPQEYYEVLAKDNNWNRSSDKNQGLKYEGRISRNRTYTVMVYPNGTVIIMIRCTKDPFRWFPREDWLALYEICNKIHQILRDSLYLGLSNPLVHSTYFDWIVTQLHLGYDYQMHDGNEKGKEITKLDMPRFNDAIKVRNLDGVACQAYVKRLPNKGTVTRIEEHLNFSSESHFRTNLSSKLSSRFISPVPPSLQLLRDSVKPKSIYEILDIIYSK